MLEEFIEFESRNWKPLGNSKIPTNSVKVAKDLDELLIKVGTQSLYDSIEGYRTAYNFYYMANPNIENPSVTDFFPKFQYYLMQSLQNCDDLTKLIPKPTNEQKSSFEHIKKVDLNRLVANNQGKLDFDDKTVIFMSHVTQKLTKQNRSTLDGHIRGKQGYSRINKDLNLYEGLTFLDQFLDEPFFENAASTPIYLTLQRYNRSLFGRLSNRKQGKIDQNKKRLFEPEGIIPSEDIANIEHIARKIPTIFPMPHDKKGDGSNTKSKQKFSSLFKPEYPASDNHVKIPYFKQISHLIKDYIILESLFTSIVSKQLKDKKVLNPTEEVKILLDYVIKGENQTTSIVKDYKSKNEVSNQGLDGKLKRIGDLMKNIYNQIPEEYTEYARTKISYEIGLLKTKLEIKTPNISKKQLGKERKERKTKITEYESNHPDQKMSTLLVEEFDKNLPRLKGQKVERFKNLLKQKQFFKMGEIQNCLDEYGLNINPDITRTYFPSSVAYTKLTNGFPNP